MYGADRAMILMDSCTHGRKQMYSIALRSYYNW